MDLQQLLIIAAIAGGFYFLVIRPQQRQAKRQREMLDALVSGSEIVTIGGIFATVVSTGDERIRVALADGAELEISPRAVSELVERADEDGATGDEAEPEDGSESGSHDIAPEDAER